jgi:cell division protein FtsW
VKKVIEAAHQFREEQASHAPTTMPMPAGATTSDVISRIDPWMAGATVLLLAIGVVTVYSASAVRGYEEGGDASGYLIRHLGSIAIGLVLLAVAMRTPVELWSKAAYPLLTSSVLLLSLIHVPGLGHRVNGSLRWLQLGPFSFQPGELAKLAVVVYLAHSLAKKREKASSFSVGFLPHAAVTSLIVALIIVQPDLGTSAVIFATLGVMMFVAGTRIAYLVLAVVFAMPVAYHYVTNHPHAFQRMLVFVHPEAYKSDIGYQVWESIVSLGSGGAVGLGLGAGQQRLHFLPESHTDFVFAVIGQELGFLGVALVIALFGILIGRGLKVASSMPCRFPMFLAFGLTSWIGIQALTNMGVAVALVPTKGLTLPLISYGRSSIIVTMLAIGILLRASAELGAQGDALEFARRGNKAASPRRRRAMA